MTTKTTAKFDEAFPRVITVSDDVREILSTIEEGDSMRVDYVTPNGMDGVEHGEIVECYPPIGDVRFDTGAYLHVNPDTGDYYFRHGGSRHYGEDGYRVTSITHFARD